MMLLLLLTLLMMRMTMMLMLMGDLNIGTEPCMRAVEPHLVL